MGSALRIARRVRSRGAHWPLDANKVAVAAGNRERLNTAVAGFSSVFGDRPSLALWISRMMPVDVARVVRSSFQRTRHRLLRCAVRIRAMMTKRSSPYDASAGLAFGRLGFLCCRQVIFKIENYNLITQKKYKFINSCRTPRRVETKEAERTAEPPTANRPTTANRPATLKPAGRAGRQQIPSRHPHQSESATDRHDDPSHAVASSTHGTPLFLI